MRGALLPLVPDRASTFRRLCWWLISLFLAHALCLSLSRAQPPRILHPAARAWRRRRESGRQHQLEPAGDVVFLGEARPCGRDTTATWGGASSAEHGGRIEAKARRRGSGRNGGKRSFLGRRHRGGPHHGRRRHHPSPRKCARRAAISFTEWLRMLTIRAHFTLCLLFYCMLACFISACSARTAGA